MIVAAIIAIAALIAFGVFGPAIGRRLPPVLASSILITGSLVLAGSIWLLLTVLSLTWLSRLFWVGSAGRFPGRLDPLNSVPEVIGVPSLLALLVLLAGGLVAARRRVRSLVGLLRDLPPGEPVDTDDQGQPLVVLEAAVPDAFTIPRPVGRIFVTTGLMTALSGTEQRVVLKHEEAHLRYLHGWWRFTAELAADFMPVLRPTSFGIRDAIERWADEYAAQRLGDRATVARAVARTALLRSEGTSAGIVSGATDGDVPRRVQALLAPASKTKKWLAGALIALPLVGGVSTMHVAATGEDQVDSVLDARPLVVAAPTRGHFPRLTPPSPRTIRLAPSGGRPPATMRHH